MLLITLKHFLFQIRSQPIMSEISKSKTEPQIRFRYNSESTGEVEISIVLPLQGPEKSVEDIVKIESSISDSGIGGDERDKTEEMCSNEDKGDSQTTEEEDRLIKSQRNNPVRSPTNPQGSLALVMSHTKFILSAIIVVLFSALILVLVLYQQSEPSLGQPNNNSSSEHRQMKVLGSDFEECPHDCLARVSAENGWLECANKTVVINCWTGFQHFGLTQKICSSKRHKKDILKCAREPYVSSDYKQFHDSVLLIVGGESDGQLVNHVETFPTSNSTACLPNLPRAVKWGSLGLLEDTSLIACGGQNRAEQPTRDCWRLDKSTTNKWKHHTQLTRYKDSRATSHYLVNL